MALSGGLDSVVLLHLLRFALPQAARRVSAAHFDHSMRPGSAADAAWVRGLCAAWGVPLHAGAASVPLRTEAEARTARYAFLRRAADDAGAVAVLTAHHADDQAETVLFRLARGAGLRGAAGIPPRRGRLRRPLLSEPRAALEAYALRHGLTWREDPTNAQAGYARNRIRHAVLPELERLQPGAAAALARFADRARAAERTLEARTRTALRRALEVRAEGVIELARPVLLGYDAELRARVLRQALRALGVRVGAAGTRAALAFISTGAAGGRVSVGRGAEVERAFERILVRAARPPRPTDRPLRVPGADDGAGEALLGGHRFAVAWGTGHPGGTGHAAEFDLSAVAFPLELRAWHPGDRVALGFGTKKVKKLFVERRLPRAERTATPLVVDATGRVLWVVGVACSTHAAVREGPVFFLTVRHVEHD